MTNPVEPTLGDIVAALVAAGVSRVYDTEAGRTFDDTADLEDPELPYAVLAADDGVWGSEELSGRTSRAVSDFTVTSVGDSPGMVRYVSQRVTTLAGRTLSAEGRTGFIEHVTSSPARPDRDNPERLVFYSVNGFTVTTDD
ncbi:hypothetical protein [Phycicoccus sp. 3266]|uniref:hypothetical protein n=1 Tax=Phycicoccus sp. 3266 TaxID=2817751 RepID=UPI00285DA400|nr:hypothetical protein [Phycicoccus sp. 3266]MDR6861973.1 hypothetical protein [Phycicoccus sp. 3266]